MKMITKTITRMMIRKIGMMMKKMIVGLMPVTMKRMKIMKGTMTTMKTIIMTTVAAEVIDGMTVLKMITITGLVVVGEAKEIIIGSQPTMMITGGQKAMETEGTIVPGRGMVAIIPHPEDKAMETTSLAGAPVPAMTEAAPVTRAVREIQDHAPTEVVPADSVGMHRGIS
jgi:hypothetical protein